MSYDDYVRHIAQKYRLALSIAVIRSKPEGLSLEGYIQQLRDKLREDQMDSDDLSIGICSDDFEIDETDVFGVNIDGNNDRFTLDPNSVRYQVNDEDVIKTLDLNGLDTKIDTNKSNTQNKQSSDDKNYEIYHQNQTNDVDMIDTQDLNESIAILQNFDAPNADVNKVNAEIEERSNFNDVMELLQGIGDDMSSIEMAVLNKNSSQPIDNNSQWIETTDHIDITQCLTDNDATLCENIENVSNVHKRRLREEYNNIFYSNQNIEERTASTLKTEVKSVVISEESDNNKKPNVNITGNITLNVSTRATETNLNNDTKRKPKIHESKFKTAESNQQNTIRTYRHTKEYKNLYQNVAGIFDAGTNKTKDTKVLKPDNVTAYDTLKEAPKDSQETIIYTIPDEFLCNTHYSESQVNEPIIIDDKYIHGTNKNNTKQESVKHVNKDTINDNDITSLNLLLTNSKNGSQMCRNSNNEYSEINVTNKIQYSKDDVIYTKIKPTRIDNDVFSHDSQLTNFLTLPTHSSQILDSNNDKYNSEDYRNEKKHAKSKFTHIDNFVQESQLTNCLTLNSNQNITVTDNSFVFSQDAQNIDAYLDHNETLKSQVQTAKDIKTNVTVSNDCTAFDKNFKNILVTDTIRTCTNFDENLESVLSNQIRIAKHGKSLETMQMVVDQKDCANFDRNLDLDKPCTNYEEKLKGTPVTTESCANFDNNVENMEVEDEWTDSQIELIPFKVIEEMNKVKVYLSRRNEKKLYVEGYSSDTGYRSDSQSKSSFKMSQSSNGWLNQAGHSLFNYLTECPLVVTTQDITNEISVVLGQLIDKLHDEERYPSFLEELLEAVQMMLGLIQEENSREDVLMKKDETIQRVLLLNKSIHIQKYTIEKITCILDNLHTDLSSNDSMYEIKNIDQIENTCYVFHLLEIILQKYKKTSQNSTQSTQNSQEDEKVLKKSNILDIWRKKWNPNYKECSNEGSSEKKCVLSSCSAVLNKLIVGCMDGYSLVSYFALKCFNVMQT